MQASTRPPSQGHYGQGPRYSSHEEQWLDVPVNNWQDKASPRDNNNRDSWQNTGPRESNMDGWQNTGPRESNRDSWQNTGPRESNRDSWQNTGPRESNRDSWQNTIPKESNRDSWQNTGPRESNRDSWQNTGPNESNRDSWQNTGPGDSNRESWGQYNVSKQSGQEYVNGRDSVFESDYRSSQINDSFRSNDQFRSSGTGAQGNRGSYRGPTLQGGLEKQGGPSPHGGPSPRGHPQGDESRSGTLRSTSSYQQQPPQQYQQQQPPHQQQQQQQQQPQADRRSWNSQSDGLPRGSLPRDSYPPRGYEQANNSPRSQPDTEGGFSRDPGGTGPRRSALGIVRPLEQQNNDKNYMEPLRIDTGPNNPTYENIGSRGTVGGAMPPPQQQQQRQTYQQPQQPQQQQPYGMINKPMPQQAAVRPQQYNQPRSEPPRGRIDSGVQSRDKQNALLSMAPGMSMEEQDQMSRDIETIKEDPDMDDSEILSSSKLAELRNQLNVQRLRLSISATDLIGKSHEELVLLLIQLRRSQARMENLHKMIRRKLETAPNNQTISPTDEQYWNELRQQSSELDKQLDVIKPLVNLLHNMVTMGSIYGGNNLMMASQYKRNQIHPDQYTPPKKMIEFSRTHQEDILGQKLEHDKHLLSADEMDLEKKLERLYSLDQQLQQTSFNVSSLQEDKMLLEKALEGCIQQEKIAHDPRDRSRLQEERQSIEAELSRVRQQLVEESRKLEDTAAENAKVEHEFILLRKKIYGLSTNPTSPTSNEDSYKVRMKIEKELDSIQSVMDGLSKQKEKLSEVMGTLKPNEDPPELSPPVGGKHKPYTETDLDTLQSADIAKAQLSPQPQQNNFNNSLPRSERSERSGGGDNEGYSLNSYSSTYREDRRTSHINPSANHTATGIPGGGQSSQHGQGGHIQAQSPGGPYPGQGGQSSFQGQDGQSTYQSHGGQSSNSQMASIDRRFMSGGELSQSNPSLHQGPTTPAFQKPTSAVYPQRQDTTHHMQDHTLGGQSNGTGNQLGQRAGPIGGNQSMTDSYRRQDRVPDQQRSGSNQYYSETRTNSTTSYRQTTPSSQSNRLSTPTSHNSRLSSPNQQNQRLSSPSQQNQRLSSPSQNQRLPDPLTQQRQTSPARLPGDNSPMGSLTRWRGYPSGVNNTEPEHIRGDKRPLPGDQRHAPAEQRSITPQNAALPRNSPMPESQPRSETASPYRDMYRASPAQGFHSTQARTQVTSSATSSGGQMASGVGYESHAPTKTSDPYLDQVFRGKSSIYTDTHIHELAKNKEREAEIDAALALGNQRASMREKPKTLRDVKKIETERRSRDRTRLSAPLPWEEGPLQRSRSLPRNMERRQDKLARRQSATSRLFPSNSGQDTTSQSISTSGSLPRDTSRYHDSHEVEIKKRARSMTLSNLGPLPMEGRHGRTVRAHSVAGDLISTRDRQSFMRRIGSADDLLDADTIDREVLFVPEKVFIPERYVPDSEDELSDTEKMKREEKALRIRRMLAAHSLQEFGQEELARPGYGPFHHQVEQERQSREHILELKHALAKQVTQRSKEVAERFYEDQVFSPDYDDSDPESPLTPRPQTPRGDLHCIPVKFADLEIEGGVEADLSVYHSYEGTYRARPEAVV